MTREEIANINPDAIIYDGFDDAILGVAQGINLNPVVVYDREKVISIIESQMIVTDDDLEEGETFDSKKHELAVEHFEYNVLGGWLGNNTPIFIITS